MDDRWFIYFEDGWLHFHRSWTGYSIYGLRLEGMDGGFRVGDSWVSRDPMQYEETDIIEDRRIVRMLIDTLLLERSDEAEIEDDQPAHSALDDEGDPPLLGSCSNTYPGALQVDLFTSSGLHGHRSVLVSEDDPAKVVAWFEQRRGSATYVGDTSWTWHTMSRVGVHTELHVEGIGTSRQPSIHSLSPSQRAKCQTVIVEENTVPSRPWWKIW